MLPTLQYEMPRVARWVRDLGYHSGAGLTADEQTTVNALVANGYAHWTRRGLKLTETGYVWLDEQESLT